ncbi:MAG TPA: hypothetical protein VNH83_30515 [Bryobacteraceae bacterium]|jgi:hypothetical protein|nr:hypothetical protein [Bryobacteraceae bacterium]
MISTRFANYSAPRRAAFGHLSLVGSIFLTGHDPDFHPIAGNTIGAQHINQDAIKFIKDPSFNSALTSVNGLNIADANSGASKRDPS